jgi:hypothetical protein
MAVGPGGRAKSIYLGSDGLSKSTQLRILKKFRGYS